MLPDPLQSTILFDHNQRKFRDAGLGEGYGLAIMRMSALVTAPLRYKGMSLGVRIARTLFPSSRFVTTEVYPGVRFSFPYGDTYWNMLFNTSTGYCPEMVNFLYAVRGEDYAFIDCGANYGYFSALVTSPGFGAHPALAVEADPDTFKLLEQNIADNNHTCRILNRAVYSRSGICVSTNTAKHEARSIVTGNGETIPGRIRTITLDDLLLWTDKQNCGKVLLKLDVEGVEIEAMKGASRLLERDLLVIFECHGADTSHQVSRYFLEKLGMRVFKMSRKGISEITAMDQIARHKRFAHVGYDFVATKSGQWLNTLLKLV